MKSNWLVLLIVLCMVCTGAATAEGTQATAFPLWEDGQSAEKPYDSLPEVDLTEKLGYMMFYPTNRSIADVGTHTLEIFLPRMDVVAGDGNINLLDKNTDAVVASFSMKDSEHVAFSAAGSSDLEWLHWETGTQILVTLDASLNINQSYYVTLDENAIVSEDYGITNPEMNTQRAWSFSTESEYGVESVKAGQDGSFVVSVCLGGEAVAAYPYLIDQGEISTDVDVLSESGDITISLSQEGVSWGISFVDANGDVLAVYQH